MLTSKALLAIRLPGNNNLIFRQVIHCVVFTPFSEMSHSRSMKWHVIHDFAFDYFWRNEIM